MKKYLYFFLLFVLLFPSSLICADKEPPIIIEKKWKAIIAYFPGFPEKATEDWVFFLFDIEEHFSDDENIYCIGIFAGDNTIVPIGPGDKSIADIDISEFAGKTAGYIFVMPGKDPVWCDYQPSFIVIQEAKTYFYRKEKEENS